MKKDLCEKDPAADQQKKTTKSLSKKSLSSAMSFIVLFGLVSLFSDMTHEGAASIRGAYFALLGASAGTIGFVSGLWGDDLKKGIIVGAVFPLVLVMCILAYNFIVKREKNSAK